MVGSGRDAADSRALARLDPKMEMNPPGATGSCVAGAAALTTPAWLTTGAVGFAETMAPTVVDPDKASEGEPAVTVTSTSPPAMS